ncbi:tRNA glutamyl-Q(34) synthetase GluQRS [Piscinibacter koreensis]|uniref:Glutamyl-Q tRNA(Asp) synthetase n=1 Tax=Piscinibacter koreensis TaxID=2742824 RepID=A0A7Y6NPV0_9BURK|nr:tRNA glutamyl-Q(34) synthetase GluQRS [Schlegelella koreensis]NUZ07110.1 tRNA glutamyl-Q(34) synthetase GluQRS [Schlegelella koreensis]
MVIGRFAPSPTGPLHAGSLVAALASWLDARAAGGRWLVRIEDVDPPREMKGAAELILQQLDRCGLRPDEPPLYQSTRGDHYQAALDRLVEQGWAYPCGCSRSDVAAALTARGEAIARPVGELVYPNTCRGGLGGKPARSFRLRVAPTPGPTSGPACDPVPVAWHDRRLGPQCQDVAAFVGDFVLRRADGFWAYQLAVVVDDAAQGITDVVRGEDLADNTARQIFLQRRLGLATPRYLHTPLVRNPDGSKLSKQTGAAAVDLADPLAALRSAGARLGIDVPGTTLAEWLERATAAWRVQWLAPMA